MNAVGIERQKNERLGEVNYNTRGKRMIISEYANATNIKVMFDNGYSVKSTYANFKVGELLNLYDTTMCDVGYLGEGIYKASINNKYSPQYNTWRTMIGRCYDFKSHLEHPTYIGCTVCDEWHNFQNFGKWYDENFYEIEGEKMRLDKDILHKGNKVYSPENCVFVPQNINAIFTKRQNDRGKYPIGVTLRKSTGKYVSACNIGKRYKRKNLGDYLTPEEAFVVYKEFKENFIKQVADNYKDKIPKILYDALYYYIVEITD